MKLTATESRNVPALGLAPAKGDTFEVPDAIGDELIAQGWCKPAKTNTAAKATDKE